MVLPVGEYTGTLRQPIMSVAVKRPVKINIVKINLSAAGGGRQAQEDRLAESGFQDMIIIPALQAQTQVPVRCMDVAGGGVEGLAGR